MRNRTAASTFVLGVLLLAVSLALPWSDGQKANQLSIHRLFTVHAVSGASSMSASIMSLVILVAILGILGLLIRQTMVLWVAAVTSLAIVILWATMTAIYKAPGNFDAINIQSGAWVSLAGCFLLLLGSILSTCKPRRHQTI